jgi:hypothetical protein
MTQPWVALFSARPLPGRLPTLETCHDRPRRTAPLAQPLLSRRVSRRLQAIRVRCSRISIPRSLIATSIRKTGRRLSGSRPMHQRAAYGKKGRRRSRKPGDSRRAPRRGARRMKKGRRVPNVGDRRGQAVPVSPTAGLCSSADQTTTRRLHRLGVVQLRATSLPHPSNPPDHLARRRLRDLPWWVRQAGMARRRRLQHWEDDRTAMAVVGRFRCIICRLLLRARLSRPARPHGCRLLHLLGWPRLPASH